MRNNIYKELFELVNATGEKLVVINPDNDEALVIMPIADYRSLKRSNISQNKTFFNDFSTADRKDEVAASFAKRGNLSFWDEAANSDKFKESIDNNPNSDRIDTVQSKSEKTVYKTAETEAEDSAGEGYYFEPTDEEIDY